MFTPTELESVPIKLEQQFRELEIRIMSDIIRRIRINSEITRSADWQIHRLNQLGMSKRDIKKLLKDSLNLSKKEVNHIYKNVIRQGYARDEQLYKTKGKPIIPYVQNEPLQQLISAVNTQTIGELENITQSLGFAVRSGIGSEFAPLTEYYQHTLDKAALDITSGAFDYNTVLKRTVSEMTNSGLRTINYATGHTNRTPVAVRRAVMTGVSQVTAKISESNAETLETDHFEVSYHLGARLSHQAWQGRVYSAEQLRTVCGYGTGAGLCGWNCNHSFDPFLEGISERTYTDEWLDKQNTKENTPVAYKDTEYTAYEATQQQRKLETQMRAERQQIKLLKEGGADENDLISARAKYRNTSAEYVRFSDTMKLPQQRDRVLIDGLGDIGKGKYTQPLHKRDYRDIMEMQGKLDDGDVRKWYLEHDKKIPELIDRALPIEQQARQACDLRNQYRTEARELMADQESRKLLDRNDPNKSFEELIQYKMSVKNLNREDAVADILSTATKTRKSINKRFGLEE